MSIALLIGLAVICVAGVVLAALQLPGTWLILAAAAAYDWYGGWTEIGWKWLVGLAVVAVIAEVADSASAVLLARRAGASRRASIGALVGGFAGMFMLSLPLPLIGTIVGGLVGCFVGAWVGEMSVRDDMTASAKIGAFAALGRLVGLIAKTGAAFAIAGATMTLAIW